MPKLHRQLVHELAEHYGIYTKSTDPEPYRHVDLVRRDNPPRLSAESPAGELPRRISANFGEFVPMATRSGWAPSTWPSRAVLSTCNVRASFACGVPAQDPCDIYAI